MVRAEDIVPVLRDAGCFHWKLGTKSQMGKGTKIADSADLGQDTDSLSENQSLDYLSTTLKRLLPGQYQIKYNSKPQMEGKGYYESVFEVGSSLAVPMAPQIGALPPGTSIEAIVAEKVQALMNQRELEDLRKKVKDLEDKVEQEPEWRKQLGFAIGNINTHAPGLFAQLLGTFFGNSQAAVAGYPFQPPPTAQPMEAQVTETAEDIKKELSNKEQEYAQVLFDLRCQDKELLTDLQKLASMAQANPGQFQMILGALRNM